MDAVNIKRGAKMTQNAHFSLKSWYTCMQKYCSAGNVHYDSSNDMKLMQGEGLLVASEPAAGQNISPLPSSCEWPVGPLADGKW